MSEKPRSAVRPTTAAADLYDTLCEQRGLRWPAGVSFLLRGKVGNQLSNLIYWPNGSADQRNSLAFGLKLLESAIDRPPANLIPLVPVDDRSIACMVCVSRADWNEDEPDLAGPAPSAVVRWHLGAIPAHHQGALLDTDAYDYLQSVADELASRRDAVAQTHTVARRYYQDYVGNANPKRPRKHIQRPIQLACQNVIVGLATLQQDATFDGLRVRNYVTCDVPHLATHEANRALLALLLCDAFQSGGTMELRFGHPKAEKEVPPALRRYARTMGLDAGKEDPLAITPAEARRLFLAVTPMPDELRDRAAVILDRGILAPERLCFTLMSGTWGPAEIAYLLATSSRVESILRGGTGFDRRRERLAEAESCRAALMAGTLFRRLSSKDVAAGGADGVRVFEDAANPIDFSVLDEEGAIAYLGFTGAPPWWARKVPPPTLDPTTPLIVVPRGLPTPSDVRLVQDLADRHPESVVALLTPADAVELVRADIPLLRCPDRVKELDTQIERRNLAMRIGRA